MAQLRSCPSNKAVAQYVAKTIHPALEAVVGEFNELGYEAELTITPNAMTGIDEHTLLVHMHDHRNFHYQVAAMEAPVPAFGARTVSREVDVYYRLEVFTQTGTEGYDLMGLSKQQVINDVLDRYEAHLSFLQYSSERDYASFVTPPRPATGMVPQVDTSEPDEAEEEGKGRE